MALVRFINSPSKIMLFNDVFKVRQVGRWCVPDTPKYNETTTLIMDRSNEDHCGTCGYNLLTNNQDINYHIINNKNNFIINKIFNDNEKYYFPFTL